MSDSHSTTPIDPEAERREKKLAATRRWRERNKEKVAAYNAAWDAAHRKEWYATNEEYRARQRINEAARREADPEAFKAAQAAKMRAWRRRNPERAKEQSDAYRRANPEKISARKRRQYRRHAHAISIRTRCKRYGLTPEQYAGMLRDCDGRCPQCRVVFSRLTNERANVDHCHRTGRIRGILCGRCNLLIGLAGDSPKLLRSLARYLERAAKAVSV